MKKIIFSLILVSPFFVHAQKYPEPEFSKEVYYLKKDSTYSVMRLEKGSSKMESKLKMGGMGGSESAYILDGEKSTVRLNSGNNLSFVFSTGVSSGSSSTSQRDSMMRANGMDPSMMEGMGGMNDPESTITLYKVESANSKRKVLLQKNPSMIPFGSKKQKSGDKYTFSVKKIKEGYWELILDKTLPGGEYAFTLMGMGMGNMDGSITIFSFAVE
ncbi:MAG TPA: hypothetical protein VN451_03585 [Chitinophagaceae bacterium]|nr:hypothetical protein [Chitinophagaceae bacterium]